MMMTDQLVDMINSAREANKYQRLQTSYMKAGRNSCSNARSQRLIATSQVLRP
jgi:hypothetical protein